MLDIVCFKYRPRRPYRSVFGPETVNTLRNMVRRNLRIEHRFTCITDDPTGIDSDIRIVPIWDDHADLANPSLPQGPSCYRRLKLFSEQARELIGERFVCLDLDVVITADVTPLFDAPDDMVIADGAEMESDERRRRPYCRFNGSMLMLRAGTRRHVWESFDPQASPRQSHAAGCRGTDQGWISYCLGAERTWKRSDGVYSYKNHIDGRPFPPNARIVLFCGLQKPWSPQSRHLDFVSTHYR